MSSSALAPNPAGKHGKSTYHHGDLRNGLLEAARALAQEVGAEALTLREVARRAHVSHAAAYHHFKDKKDLLRALAIQAFSQLDRALQASQDPTPEDPFEAMGTAYLRFGLQHPAEFHFMFSRDLCMPDGEPDPLEEASRGAEHTLHELVRSHQENGYLKTEDERLTALTVWSTIHGLTTMILETPAFKNTTLGAAEHMARGVIGQMLDGIKRS